MRWGEPLLRAVAAIVAATRAARLGSEAVEGHDVDARVESHRG
jgi:hypothetical protein